MSDYRRNQAWQAGRKAAQQGKPLGANPRQRGTIYFDDWDDGWLYGHRERKEGTGDE